MAKYKLSRLAEADLEAVLEYTLQAWGERQAERYLTDMEACFREIADRPLLGRSCDAIRPGLRRMEHGRHILFYRQREYGIRVIRVLHQAMLPEHHLLGEID